MQHLLLTLFSAVCGENPGHIWSPGGQALPCCERCTGLYAGTLVAVALQLWYRPAITTRFLQLHALCLLQLGLFVFPWLPQSAVLRTISGALFGFGVVAFLWPAISDWRLPFRTARFGIGDYATSSPQLRHGKSQFKARPHPCPLPQEREKHLPSRVKWWRFGLMPNSASAITNKKQAYTIGLAGCLALIPAIAEWDGRAGAFLLTGLVLAGAIALAFLASVNVVRCVRAFSGLVEAAEEWEFQPQIHTDGRR